MATSVLTEHSEMLHPDVEEYRDGIRAQAVGEEVADLPAYIRACKELGITSAREQLDIEAMKTFPAFDVWPAEYASRMADVDVEHAKAAKSEEEHRLAHIAARTKRLHLESQRDNLFAQNREMTMVAELNPFLLGPVETAARYAGLPALTLQEAGSLMAVEHKGRQEVMAENLRNRKLAEIKKANEEPRPVNPNEDFQRQILNKPRVGPRCEKSDPKKRIAVEGQQPPANPNNDFQELINAKRRA